MGEEVTGDPIENDIFSSRYPPLGKPIHVVLAKTSAVLIGAEVFRVAYEEAIRKWRIKLGQIYAAVDMVVEVDVVPQESADLILPPLKKMIEEMDQTVKPS